MTIGKGIIKTDDYIKFGKTVDKLAEIAYTVTYSVKTDMLIVCIHRDKLDELKREFGKHIVSIKTPKRGILVFVKIKWR